MTLSTDGAGNSHEKNDTNGGAYSKHDESNSILGEIVKNAESLRNGNEKSRDAIVADCFRLVAALETPSEAFMRIMWTYSIHPPVIRLASDMGIFDELALANGAPKTSAELAQAGKHDARLTSTILKVLASGHLVREVGVDTYVATPFATSMAKPMWKAALDLMTPYSAIANQKTPEYFKERNYAWPTNAMDCPIQYATGDSNEMNFFQVMKRDDKFKGLESLMKVWLDDRPHWSNEESGFYPVHERLINGADRSSDSVFLVDLGGGHGQDFLRLLTNVPKEEIPGRLVLQDLPLVISQIPADGLPGNVERQSHDFFQEQPINGARVYFMHNIIHNHMDAASKNILKRVAAAMKKGYSKLLIWDTIMPDRGAGTNVCALDWEMLTFYGTSERTETQWRKLIEDPEIGLKVTDVVHYSNYDQDLIEVELA